MIDLKEFFQLTQGKIILIIFLCFFAIYLGITLIKLEAEIDRGLEVSLWKVKLLQGIEIILIGPVYSIARYEINLIIFSERITRYITLKDMLLIITISILLIFYWYLLSCLINFIYKNLIEKRKQPPQTSQYPYY